MTKNFSSKDTVGAILLAVVAIAVIIAGVMIVGMVLSKDDGNQKNDNTTPTITTTDETRTTETAPTTENRKEIDKQIAAAIAQAEELAVAGDYDEAITQIQTWLKTYSDSEILQEKLAEYTTARNTQIKVDAIAAADELRNQGNYLDALLTIRQAIAEIGEDDDLTTQAATCESAYATIVSQQVDEFQQKMSISEAKELLREALEYVPENELLISRMTEMESYKTVRLDTLSPFNGGFAWNEGVAGDPFGNSYSKLQNHVILHSGNNSWDGHGGNTATHSVKYRVEKEYDTLSFNLVPYSEFGENGWSYLRIYVNDGLRYTSDKITKETQPHNISVDISDAEYIEIVVYTDEFSCTMMTDVLLSKLPDYVSSRTSGYTSLSVVDIFDGSLPWEDDFPCDTLKSDYNNVNNYAVLHAAYSSWDGHGGNAQSYYVKYHTNKRYSSLSFDIAPAEDFKSAGCVNIKVYADDVPIYTAPAISMETERFNTGDIDISQASFIEIVAEIDEHSCTIISDVLLKNAE